MIQYNHIKNEATLFLDTPYKATLMSMVSFHSGVITLRAGLAVRYYQDQFSKKVGRAVSESNATFNTFTFCELRAFPNKNIYEFYGTVFHNNDNIFVRFYLTTVPNSDRVYLINAEVELT